MTIETPLPDVKEHADAPTTWRVAGNTGKGNGEISLLDILVAIVERRRIVLWITAASAIIALIVSLVLPVRYTATVVLLPPQQNSSVGSALTSQLGNLGGMAALAGGTLGLKNPNDMFVAMLKSRTVEDAMVQRFNLMQEYHKRYLSEARKAFEDHVTVDGSGKDSLLRISVSDREPRRAAELANGYTDQFRTLSEHLAITEASQRRLFFEQQLQQAKDNLANAEESLKRTQQTTGLIELSGQARALFESATELRALIAAKEVEIAGMQTYATSQNSQLVEQQRELDGLQAQLAKLGGSEDSSGGLIVPQGRVPEASLEYMRKLRDVKYYETIFDILARQFEIAKLDEAKEGAIIQVVDSAIPPDKRSFPKRGIIVIIATAVGFLIGLFVALLKAGFAEIKSDQEVSAKLAFVKRGLSIRRLAGRSNSFPG